MSMLVFAIVFCYPMYNPSGQCKQYSQFYTTEAECTKALRIMAGARGIPDLACRSKRIEVWQ